MEAKGVEGLSGLSVSQVIVTETAGREEGIVGCSQSIALGTRLMVSQRKKTCRMGDGKA